MRLNESRLLKFCAALAMLALSACGTAPKLSVPASPVPVRPTQHAPAPVAKAPAASKPEAGVPVLPPANSGRGGYYQDDGPGDAPPPDLASVPDADVRNDPLLPRSNRPYVVFGKTYTPITDTQPFLQVGVGSWYGKKFHGQRTSSGELYDMYKMTAAHPTLPIPSYARLTNMVSGAVVVVRINDRGPFHADRAIDVSYTAALKLGLLGKGSHELQIERILPDEIDRMLATRAGVSGSTAPRLPSQSPSRLASSGGFGAAQSSSALALSQPLSQPLVQPLVQPISQPLGQLINQPLVLVPKAVPATIRSATTATATAAASTTTLGGPGVGASSAIEALMLADRAPPESGELPGAPVGAEALAASTGGAEVKGGYYLQLGAYSRAENAEAARSKLAQSGGGVNGLEVVQGGSVYRLFGGPFASRQEALQAAQGLPSSFSLKPIVVQR